MNGRITIELAGVSTPLTFGMLAIEEFGKRQAVGASGMTKLMIDLVYSGYCNEEILNGRNPVLSYRDISEAMDNLIMDESPILGQVFICFEESKAGAKLLGAVKKKQEADQTELKPKQSKKRTGTKSKDLLTES